ncbi:hypothetical protein HYQ46_007356 [Verticillium longisporum]|nr:hypothetical protein HYQ46_007356 [Verticillium longisporum]
MRTSSFAPCRLTRRSRCSSSAVWSAPGIFCAAMGESSKRADRADCDGLVGSAGGGAATSPSVKVSSGRLKGASDSATDTAPDAVRGTLA